MTYCPLGKGDFDQLVVAHFDSFASRSQSVTQDGPGATLERARGPAGVRAFGED